MEGISDEQRFLGKTLSEIYLLIVLKRTRKELKFMVLRGGKDHSETTGFVFSMDVGSDLP